jgi:DNA-binding CsgD family transcriptional regulator
VGSVANKLTCSHVLEVSHVATMSHGRAAPHCNSLKRNGNVCNKLRHRLIEENSRSAGDAAVGIKGIAVPILARDGERYVAHVLPLTSGTRGQAGTSYAAVAALFVHKAALDTPSPPEAIAKAYRLTQMELRVMLAIVEVVPQAAETLGVAETTVKTHLGRIYNKTGSHRQADLVKLIAGYSKATLAPSSDRRMRQGQDRGIMHFGPDGLGEKTMPTTLLFDRLTLPQIKAEAVAEHPDRLVDRDLMRMMQPILNCEP